MPLPDEVAVLPARPGDAELDALAAAHAAVRAARPRPLFEGIHLTGADLAGPPDSCPDLPHVHDGKFGRAGRFEINPVTWHVLASSGIAVRGPALAGQDVWTDERVLWDFSHANLSSRPTTATCRAGAGTPPSSPRWPSRPRAP